MSDITKTVDIGSSRYRSATSAAEPETISFDLGEHPSEVLARRAVWTWPRRKWWRSLKSKRQETPSANKENIDAVFET